MNIDKSISILIINTFFPPDGTGGAERSVFVLAKGLADKGHNVTVLCTTKNKKKVKHEKVSVIGISGLNVFWLGSSIKKSKLKKILWHFLDTFNLVAFLKTFFILKDLKPDIVHTNNLTGFCPSIFLAVRLFRIPVVHTLRDYYLGCLQSDGINCGRICPNVKVISKFLSKNVSTVVGNSEYILNWHIERDFFINSNKNVIFNGFEKQFIKAKLTSKRKSLIFGYIGAISKHKGVELLCDQFVKFCKSELKTHQLIIAGTGDKEYSDFLIKKFKNKNISFTGYMQPEDYYTMIDWNIVPSIWNEPLARVCFEPKFYGIPVISSNRGGNPEAVKHMVDGLIFDPAIKDDLLEKLKISEVVDYELFSKNSYSDKDRFKIPNLISAYEKIYKKLLANS